MSNIHFRNLTVTVLLGLASTAAFSQEPPPRVKAKEPTVVTVEGKREQVREDEKRAKAEAEKDRNVFSKAMHGLGKGFSIIGRGIGGWINGMGDSEEVIPSAEERRRSANSKQQ
jgi:hypothetical protein